MGNPQEQDSSQPSASAQQTGAELRAPANHGRRRPTHTHPTPSVATVAASVPTQNLPTLPSTIVRNSNVQTRNRQRTAASNGVTRPEQRRQHTVTENGRFLDRDTWNYDITSYFACFSCVVGMYNMCRFGLMVYVYKACFIVEFVILSALLGVPFFFLQMALGQHLGSGLLGMWCISPAFTGVGIALLYSYVIIGVYTAVPIAWLFTYFRDSFISTREPYKWSMCNTRFATESCLQSQNTTLESLGWTVSSYLNGRVLDRRPTQMGLQFGDLRFEIAFNLGIVWLLVFCSLCRGLRTFGKVIFVIGILPPVLLLLVSMRFLESWGDGLISLFTVPWKDIMADSTSWLMAAREVVLTWALFGAVALHMCSHNKQGVNLIRNLVTLAAGSITMLIISSLFFASAIHILHKHNLVVVPSSYEEEVTSKFLALGSLRQWDSLSNSTAINLLVGESILPEVSEYGCSGYQVLRFATEIFPAAVAAEGPKEISSFWAISFYTMLILFGLGQLICVWSVVSESVLDINPKVLRGWQTMITFISCNVGFLLGLPMTTNIGVFIVYFFDFCIGSLWWLVGLYLIMLIAILFIRGRPYGTDHLVNMLTTTQSSRHWMLPLLTFQWNVVLPVSFLVLSIAFLRSGPVEESFSWAQQARMYPYWQPWAKKLAIFLQISPLAMVAIGCAFQAVKYLSPKSRLPMHERVQAWCCPIYVPPTSQPAGQTAPTVQTSGGIVNGAYVEDPPPKYTPPPSYSTATARMIMHQLQRQKSSEGLPTIVVTQPLPAAQVLSEVELLSYLKSEAGGSRAFDRSTDCDASGGSSAAIPESGVLPVGSCSSLQTLHSTTVNETGSQKSQDLAVVDRT